MTRMTNACVICGQREKEDLVPFVVTLTAFKAGEFAGFFDPTQMPGWLRALAAMPNPRIEMHASCVGDMIAVSPSLIRPMLDKEVIKEHLTPETAAQIMAVVEDSFSSQIRSVAGTLPEETT